jgi:NAD(P)-dependent dehydrogenase (short-subunit alcohol dehydrogenase family)
VTAPFDMNMAGRIALVTGATSGIGTEIARGLARLGATVVVTSRDPARGAEVRAELASFAPARESVVVMPLDVADVASVRSFATALGERYHKLDVLVNNAGAWFSDRRESVDGIELTFATNVVGPYLLSELLSPLLGAAGHARVVNIGSSIAGNYDATDLNFTTRRYSGWHAYAQSKQAIRMVTWGQAARLAESGTTANVVAPGFVRTGLNRNAHGAQVAFINMFAKLFAVSPARGAETPLWAAVDPALADVTGKYLVGRKAKEGGFADPAALADLEHRCDQMIAAARTA